MGRQKKERLPEFQSSESKAKNSILCNYYDFFLWILGGKSLTLELHQLISCVYVWSYMCHGGLVDVRGKSIDTGSLLLCDFFWHTDTGFQCRQQAALFIQPCCQP